MKKLLSIALALMLAVSCMNAAVFASDAEDTTVIRLSDSGITVDGKTAPTDETAAVYTAHDIVYYEAGKDFTIRNFAEVYAPRKNRKGAKENDTDKYIADISADSGFDPDVELHRFDEGDMARFLKSVVRFESGAPHSAWFTDKEYEDAAKKLDT